MSVNETESKWGRIYPCTAKGCCCGGPVHIKTEGGRKVVYHIR